MEHQYRQLLIQHCLKKFAVCDDSIYPAYGIYLDRWENDIPVDENASIGLAAILYDRAYISRTITGVVPMNYWLRAPSEILIAFARKDKNVVAFAAIPRTMLRAICNIPVPRDKSEHEQREQLRMAIVHVTVMIKKYLRNLASLEEYINKHKKHKNYKLIQIYQRELSNLKILLSNIYLKSISELSESMQNILNRLHAGYLSQRGTQHWR